MKKIYGSQQVSGYLRKLNNPFMRAFRLFFLSKLANLPRNDTEFPKSLKLHIRCGMFITGGDKNDIKNIFWNSENITKK